MSQKRIILSHPRGDLAIGEDEPPVFAAEIGLNHNGDLKTATEMIRSAAKSGAHYVKFQAFFAEDLFHPEKTPADLFAIFKRCSLAPEQLYTLKKYCDSEGIGFAATPFSPAWVAILKDLRVPYLKIASGDLVNPVLVHAAAAADLPLVISSGASTYAEIASCLNYLRNRNFSNFILLYCVSLYPAPPQKIRFSVLLKFMKDFGCLCGFSDHSAGFWAAPISVALGARFIEKHFTTDTALPGPDNAISATPEIFQSLVTHCDIAYGCMREQSAFPHEEEQRGNTWGRRGMYSGDWRDLEPGWEKTSNLEEITNKVEAGELRNTRPDNGRNIRFP